MLRLTYVIIISLPVIVVFLLAGVWVEAHGERYGEVERYRLARQIAAYVCRASRINTTVTGVANLPEEGGYVMYANHQGKYDTLGIINSHEQPCTFLIDAERSHLPLVDQFSRLIRAARIDKESIRSQVALVKQISREVENGRRYIIFPEGGYTDNRNKLQTFLPGAFKCAMKARRPIVPVALIDSWKPFGINSLRRVKTQVHYLRPIRYEDYRNLRSSEIADLVKNEIQACLDRYAG